MIRIREFRWRDYDDVAALWAAAGRDVLPREELTAKLTRDPQLFLVAKLGGAVAGVVLGTYDGRRGWILRLAVDPAHRRRGIATMLVGERDERYLEIAAGVTNQAELRAVDRGWLAYGQHMSIDAGARSWLRRRGAEAIDHPGGTLYGHLCRVQERLAALGSDVATQLAGLTHAVYGTDGFDLALLDRTNRAALRNLVGEEAEALVYLYGACDRERSWRDLATTSRIFDRFTREFTTLGSRQVQPFVDLSIVNELDVIEQDRSVADRHGAYFRELFAAWAPVTSPQIARDAQRVLDR